MICLSCGEVLISRLIDESCEWRTSTNDDVLDTSAARASEKDSLFGASMTQFIGGSEAERKLLEECQENCQDPKEMLVLRHLYLVKQVCFRLHLPREMIVSHFDFLKFA